MSELQPARGNGSWLLYWRWAVGGSLVAAGAAIYSAGGIADDVEENTTGRLKMGDQVHAIETRQAAAAVTAKATVDRLEKIEDGVKDNASALRRIEVLLGPPPRAGDRVR